MKQLTFAISAVVAGCMVLTSCKPSAQKKLTSEVSETTTKVEAESTDSVVTETAAPEYLTFAKAMELVKPGQKLEPSAIEQLFASMQLPMQLAEQYISDADWGGDSQAINYCFGNNVNYVDYKFAPTGEDYYGVHTNFFFDDSRKTGTVSRFAVITSDSLWYIRLLDDATAEGLIFKENVDSKVYGKRGKLFQKVAGKSEHSSENANYYLFDFSTPGHYDIEVGYDSGLDI